MPKGSSRSKHHLNLSAFAEPLSAEARYWIGFLLADGYISKRKGYDVIGLGLKFEDAEHVRKFARFCGVREESVLEFYSNTTFGRQHGVKLQFTGKQLIPQLAKYGVVPRKTEIAAVPSSLSQDPDFWRGLIDGDGSVFIDHRGLVFVGMCGTMHIVEGFRDICNTVAGFRPAIGRIKSIFKASLGGSKAVKLLTWLYYPEAVALKRKAIAWQKV